MISSSAQSQLRKLVVSSSLGAAMVVTAIIDLFDHGLTRTFFLATLTAITPTYFAARIYVQLRDLLGESE